MDNSEQLTALGTKEEDKQNKTNNAICIRQHYTKANTHNVNKA
jgi:hypothetical protein